MRSPSASVLVEDSVLAPANHRTAWWVYSLAPLVVGAIWINAVPAISAGPVVSSLAGFVLVQLLLVVTTTDLVDRKIPNWATYPAFAWALAINLAGVFFPDQADWLGSVGLAQSAAGGFGLFAIMLVIFSLSGGGAGDVKLSACLGALMGWSLALDAMLYSFVVAGAGMLCIGIWTQGPLLLAKTFSRGVLHWLLPTKVNPPEPKQRELLRTRFPLAPFFCAGTIIAITLNRSA